MFLSLFFALSLCLSIFFLSVYLSFRLLSLSSSPHFSQSLFCLSLMDGHCPVYHMGCNSAWRFRPIAPRPVLTRTAPPPSPCPPSAANLPPLSPSKSCYTSHLPPLSLSLFPSLSTLCFLSISKLTGMRTPRDWFFGKSREADASTGGVTWAQPHTRHITPCRG